MNKKQKLAKNIKQFRKKTGLSQEEFAGKIGLSRVAYSQFETGKRSLDALELFKIAKVFNVSVDYLLNDEENREAGLIKKSRKPTIKEFKVDKEKLRNVILYLLEKCGGKPNVGETVLYKLLYFIDFNSYELTGQPVTGMNYVKLQFGPVPRAKEYNAVIEAMKASNALEVLTKDYHGRPQTRYVALVESNISVFNTKEIKAMDEVIAKLSDMNASQIEDYVHKDAPWEIAEEKQIIPYNLVLERVAPYAHYDYEKMWQEAAASDTMKELGPIPEEEVNYYKNI